MLTGRILRGVGGLYWVDGQDGAILQASARGLFRKNREVPTAGDLVDCEPSGDPDRPWSIRHIHPRRNFLVRPAVANLDGLVITVSATDPPPDFMLVDKLLAISYINGIEPLLVLTKTDLTEDTTDLLQPYRPVGCLILETAPQDETGVAAFEQWLAGKTACLAGQSGVGKSTLMNRLHGETVMSVGSISERIGRGRHTTREVVFFPVAGGYLADTPGFSTLELPDIGINGDQLADGYPEIRQVRDQCHFNDCRHIGEPGCAVSGSEIDPERLERYRQLRSQLDALDPYQKKARPKGLDRD
jgi:ribosome biogenesis GTPase